MSATQQPDLDRVASQHRRLLELLTQLDTTTDVVLMLDMVSELQTLLSEHFELEECAGGFFDQALQDAPLAEVTVDRLVRDHALLRQDAFDVGRHLQACIEGPVASVRRDVANLARELREHERVEAALLTESMSQDIGGG